MAKRKQQLSDKLAVLKMKKLNRATQPAPISKFEQKFTKEKHNVMGRKKSKGSRSGAPTISKAKAFEHRRQTLGAEAASFYKSNRFSDRRLGEHGGSGGSSALSKDEKMLKRLALLRSQRYSKKGKFNLNDDDDENNDESSFGEKNESLTHYGQSLAEIERFELRGTEGVSDDEENVYNNGMNVASLHFGGDEAEEQGKKSRKEIINEMIAKSKMSKHEKQSQKQEAQTLTEQLDEQWRQALEMNLFAGAFSRTGLANESGDDNVSSVQIFETSKLNLVPKSDSSKTEQQKAKEASIGGQKRTEPENCVLDRESCSPKKLTPPTKIDTSTVQIEGGVSNNNRAQQNQSNNNNQSKLTPAATDYDTLVRELTFGRRTGPACNPLTSLEKQQEKEQKRLDQLESERQKRAKMDYLGEEKALDGGKNSTNQRVAATHFNPDDMDATNCGVGRRRRIGEQEKSEIDEYDEENCEQEEDSPNDDLLNEIEREFISSKTTLKRSKKKKSKSDDDKNKNEAILTNSNQQLDENVVQQIIISNSSSSSATNSSTSFEFDSSISYDKFKNQLERLKKLDERTKFLDSLHESLNPGLKPGNKILLRKLFLYLLRYFDEKCSESSLDFKFIDQLTTLLFKLKEYGKENAAKSVKALLKKHRHEVGLKIRKSKSKTLSSIPSNIVCFLRLIPRLFPSSDFVHPIVTPCYLFLAEILSNFRQKPKNLRQFAQKLLICTLFYEYAKDAKKYAPDLVYGLQGLLEFAVTDKSFRESLELEPSLLRFSAIFDPNSNNSPPQIDASSCLNCLLHLSTRLCGLYSHLPSFPEIFEPILKKLQNLNEMPLNPKLKHLIDGFNSEYKKSILAAETHENRKRLAFSAVTAENQKEFEFLEPRMEANFNPDKKKFQFGTKGPKAERAKLRHQYKKEYKGTVRELRRDNEFLARQQFAENVRKDTERQEKTKRLMASLMGQEGDYKKMKRAKD